MNSFNPQNKCEGDTIIVFHFISEEKEAQRRLICPGTQNKWWKWDPRHSDSRVQTLKTSSASMIERILRPLLADKKF